MGRSFEAAGRGATAAAGAAYATIICQAGGRGRLRELHFFASTAVAASVGLGRAANTPVASTTIPGQARDPADTIASLCGLGIAWSTAPTIPANFNRRMVLPAVIGAGAIWTWPGDPLIVPPTAAGTSLVLWNFGIAAGPAPDITAIWEE